MSGDGTYIEYVSGGEGPPVEIRNGVIEKVVKIS